MFRADWDDTRRLLAEEIDRIGGLRYVLELDVAEGEIRADGRLRAGVEPATPRVRVSFESRHGPLRYATDAYEQRYRGSMKGWQANVRGIALGLEALRAVDRYGISARAEQYVGYKAIGPGTTAVGGREAMPRDLALKVISDESGFPIETLADSTVLRSAIKRARAATHPDVYRGDGEPWNAVRQAVDALAADLR